MNSIEETPIKPRTHDHFTMKQMLEQHRANIPERSFHSHYRHETPLTQEDATSLSAVVIIDELAHAYLTQLKIQESKKTPASESHSYKALANLRHFTGSIREKSPSMFNIITIRYARQTAELAVQYDELRTERRIFPDSVSEEQISEKRTQIAQSEEKFKLRFPGTTNLYKEYKPEYFAQTLCGYAEESIMWRKEFERDNNYEDCKELAFKKRAMFTSLIDTIRGESPEMFDLTMMQVAATIYSYVEHYAHLKKGRELNPDAITEGEVDRAKNRFINIAKEFDDFPEFKKACGIVFKQKESQKAQEKQKKQYATDPSQKQAA